MPAQVARPAVDLGIVVSDKDAALRFYRDMLGLAPAGEMTFPDGRSLFRVMAGETTLKIWSIKGATQRAAPNGVEGTALGTRYWTMHVKNMDEIVAAAKKGGYRVAWEPREIRPGTRVAMIEDPDGNWVEFLEAK